MSVKITLKHAKNIEEEDGISKNDLYAKITYAGRTVKTKQADDGALPLGYKYSWDQSFEFDLTHDNDIEVKLYDADVGFDDFVGEAKFLLTHAKQRGTAVETVNVINKKGETKGSITAEIVVRT